MKRTHSLLAICLGLAVFFIAIVAGQMNATCLAALSTGQNYFEIWYYGVTQSSPDVQRLVRALYGEANAIGISVDDLSLVNKGPSIINDLNNGTNTYGFDVTGPAYAGNGMYGYFSDPRNSYFLRMDVLHGITTYLFGLVWVEDDGDGVPASTEDQVPNPTGTGTGDGNGDGTPDRNQSNVTSLQGAGSAYVTISNTGNIAQTNVHAVNPPGDVPANVTFPYGMFSFDINGLQNGGTAHMQIYVPRNSAINGYWKKNRLTGQWDNIATSITTMGSKTVISFNLTDGGAYDEDGSVNGAIRDQGGPGIIGANAAPVPTMNQWGSVILTCFMGLAAVLAMRRKMFGI